MAPFTPLSAICATALFLGMANADTNSDPDPQFKPEIPDIPKTSTYSATIGMLESV